MHCPQCGQQQVSDETRFCSRCGFLLTGIAEVMANNGIVPGSESNSPQISSPRKRGLKQGLFIFLLAFLIVPIITILTIAANAEPFAVVISVILLTVGGLLRMAYALMFESNVAGEKTLEERMLAASKNLKPQASAQALPPQQSIPVSDYVSPAAGAWRDTNDLQHQPGSVIDHTTKLLEKEHGDQ